MYMKVYEFRKDLKAAFDSALRGEEVQIERGGVSYKLTAEVRTITQPRVVPKVLDKVLDSIEKPYNKKINSSADADLGAVKNLFPKSKTLCKVHGTPLTLEGKCLQKGH